MRVLFMPEVRDYFDELESILYEKGYFSFEESSHKYANELFADIIAYLPVKVHKPAPSRFDHIGKGMYYAAFRRNRQTTWYIFFTRYDLDGETVYLVRYIANNHVVSRYL
jgi:hypothetical protein